MRLLEAGHYYATKGPTVFSKRGWEILENVSLADNKSLLFIDDVHTSMEDVNKEERDLPIIDFAPLADFTVLESAMREWAFQFLDMLKVLPKRSRAKQSKKNGVWFYADIPLTNKYGEPLCVLLDAGLTLFKQRVSGFNEAINILPFFYEKEQQNLLRLTAKAMPDFRLKVILFDENRHWLMEPNNDKRETLS